MVFPGLQAPDRIGVLVCDPGDTVELDDDPVSPWFSQDSAAVGPQPVDPPKVSPSPGDVAAPSVPVQAPSPDGTGGDSRTEDDAPSNAPQVPAAGAENGPGADSPTEPTETPTGAAAE